MAVLTKQQILEIIPHRDPFLLVDEIDYLDMPTMHVKGRKFLTGEEYFFKGHFPDQPIMPGVLMLESVAQTGAVCVLNRPEFKGKVALFARADNVRFKGSAFPGDTIETESKMTKMKAGVCISEGTARVNGIVIMTAQITCVVK